MTRDIAELDTLAHEIKVRLDKANNHRDSAKKMIADVIPVFARDDFGETEFGNPWTLGIWLSDRVGLGFFSARQFLPRPKEFAKLMLAANPSLSDRAIAAQIGIDHKTVAAARTGEKSPVGKRVGLDGKERRVPAAQATREQPSADIGQQQLTKLLDAWGAANSTIRDLFLASIGAVLVKSAPIPDAPVCQSPKGVCRYGACAGEGRCLAARAAA